MKFISDIKDNLQNVRREEIEKLYSALYPEEDRVAVYLEGELGGRSLQALKIGSRQLSLKGIPVYSTGYCFTPGTDIFKSFEYLSKEYDKCVYICISGSGNSRDTYSNLEKLTDGKLDKNVSLNLITSTPNSKIGNLFKENNGNIIELKGRKSKAGIGKAYVKEGGLLEDEFELGAAQYAQIVSDGVMNEVEPGEFYGYYLGRIDDLEKTKETITRLKGTEAYNNLLECLGNPVKNVISYGQGVGEEVAKMNTNRLGHIRPLTVQKVGLGAYRGLAIGANHNYVLGESNTPKIDKDTVLLCVSQSGTGTVRDHIKDAEKANANYFIITREGISLEENALRLDNAQNFYPDSCILLSKILMDLGIDLVEQGVDISHEILIASHVNDKMQ
jgi:hypothetical protein